MTYSCEVFNDEKAKFLKSTVIRKLENKLLAVMRAHIHILMVFGTTI